MTTLTSDRRWHHPATVAAIAALVYVTASVVHEVIGHAGSGLLFGVTPAVISSTYVLPAAEPAAAWQRAATSGAGGLANLVTGLVALVLMHIVSAPRWRYFLWLSSAVNLFFCGSYLAASSLFAFGDWTDAENQLGVSPAGRMAIAAAGVVLCGITLLTARRGLEPFLPEDASARRRMAQTLVRTAWVAGTLAVAAAGLLGSRPSDVAYSLAWTLGGTALLLLIPHFLRRGSASAHEPLVLTRGRGWIAAAAVVSILYIVILGHGLHFGAARTRVSASLAIATRQEPQ